MDIFGLPSVDSARTAGDKEGGDHESERDNQEVTGARMGHMHDAHVGNDTQRSERQA
ncbi:hypothetical protein [Comamonas odontotermitis]|uniref:hypothetical protein n=1 Tax=Comamonas odontotermitis TaxID=379895 RepID=UPI0016183E4A|nr:hypothetical protein [Comamonas odontotermitis]